MSEEAKKIMHEHSIYHLLSLLFVLPFVCITSYLDVYSLFSVEAMHLFHLAVSIMIKEASKEHLQCTLKTTDHEKIVQGSIRTFARLLLPIIIQINKFVGEITMQ